MKNILLILMVCGLLPFGGCRTITRPTDPTAVTEPAELFLPVAVNVMDRLDEYLPDESDNQALFDADAPGVYAALADPDKEIRVILLEPLLWMVPIHNQYVEADTSQTLNWRQARIQAATALQMGLTHYLKPE